MRRTNPGRFRALLPGLLVAAVLTTFETAPAAGQSAPPEPKEHSRFSGSLTLLNTQPLGGLQTGPGFGIDLSGAWALDGARWLRLRGELRGAQYGRDTRRACLSETVGCLIEVDINTDYGSFFLGAGPELAIPVFGGLVVLDATAGVGGFSVTSSVQGTQDTDEESMLTTTNLETRVGARRTRPDPVVLFKAGAGPLSWRC